MKTARNLVLLTPSQTKSRTPLWSCRGRLLKSIFWELKTGFLAAAFETPQRLLVRADARPRVCAFCLPDLYKLPLKANTALRGCRFAAFCTGEVLRSFVGFFPSAQVTRRRGPVAEGYFSARLCRRHKPRSLLEKRWLNRVFESFCANGTEVGTSFELQPPASRWGGAEGSHLKAGVLAGGAKGEFGAFGKRGGVNGEAEQAEQRCAQNWKLFLSIYFRF